MKSSVELLRKRVDQLEERTDEADAGDRSDMLSFSGEVIHLSIIGENFTNILCNLIKYKCTINIEASDIAASYRLGRKPFVQGLANRKIVIKLCRRVYSMIDCSSGDAVGVLSCQFWNTVL